MREGQQNMADKDDGMIPQDFDGAKVALFIGENLLTILRDNRPDIPFRNMWDFPGGGREAGETPFETMAREVLEEVSLTVPRGAVIWEKKYLGSSAAAEPRWFFVAQLPATMAGLIALGDEGQRWALVSEAAYLAKPDAIPHMQSRLRDWQAQR